MLLQPFNKGYETNVINNNNFIYMCLVILIIINFEEDINRSYMYPELRLDLKSPELELELKFPELELKLIVSSGNGIGIENNRIGIELKKWNWPQPCATPLLIHWSYVSSALSYQLWMSPIQGQIFLTA